jgi:ribosomal protein S7
MTKSEIDFRKMIVGTYINELFVDGTDSTSVSILRDALKPVVQKILRENG